MKRIFALLLSSTYLLLTIGIVTHVHFCHGNISDIKIFQETKSCCSPINHSKNYTESKNSKSLEENSCCINETYVIQLPNENKISSKILSFKILPIYISTIINCPINNYISIIIEKSKNIDFSPPPKIPKFRLHCEFVYYG